MANHSSNDESLGELYARIGLDFDEIENGFIQVERTLNQNIGRLNRSNRVINIQQRVELLGLDEVNDAERIFEIRTRNLNRQLENERARLRLLQASLEDTARQTGADSDATQRAEIAFENARLSVARLENQLQELNENHNRGTNWADEIVAFSQKAAPVISVARALFQAFGMVKDATDELVEKFRELQKNAYNFNLPIDKADDFTRKLRLAGAEIDDVGGYLRGMTDALIKGETDDPEFIALQKYGESIFDASGKLKNYAEIWESVHRAYQKAKKEGKEIEFLQLTGGESGVTDAIQALERWEKAVESANKIVKANIDYKSLEKADTASKVLSEQFDELGKSISDTFSPATTKAAEQLFEILKSGTEWIVAHKADLTDLWQTPSLIFSPLESYKHMLKQERAESKRLIAEMKDRDGTLKELFKNSAGLDKAHEDLKKRLDEKKQKENDPLHQYAIQRTNDLKDNIADLRVALDYESEYQQAIKTAQLERERALRQIVVGDKERAAIDEKYRTDIEAAEKAHAEKLEDLWRETAAIQYEQNHSAYQKEIYDIHQWRDSALDALGDFNDAIGDKNKWIEESAAIVANAAAKEARAYEKEIDSIKGKTMTLAEKIFEKTHSQAERDIFKAQKEYMELWQEGIYPKDMIDLNYKLTIGEILANNDLKYNQVPNIKMALPDVDFYTPLNAAIDGLIDSYKELDEVQKQALNLPNIPARIADFSINPPNVPDIPNAKMDIDVAKVEAFKASLETSIEPIKITTSYFENSLTSAVNAVTAFSNSLITATDQISKIQAPKIAEFESKKIPSLSSELDDKNILPKLKQLQMPLDFTKDLREEMKNATHQMAELTKYVGAIAQDANKRTSKPPVVNINPSPTININLTGSYILTQAMANKMQDDIATEVYNNITAAVTTAINNIDIPRYGN